MTAPAAPTADEIATAHVAAASPHRVTTLAEVDRHIATLRAAAAAPTRPGQNSRPAILTLLRRRVQLGAAARVPVYTVPTYGTGIGTLDPFDVDPAEVF